MNNQYENILLIINGNNSPTQISAHQSSNCDILGNKCSFSCKSANNRISKILEVNDERFKISEVNAEGVKHILLFTGLVAPEKIQAVVGGSCFGYQAQFGKSN